jgi:hypothetical protein
VETARIKCDRTPYALPAGKHKGSNLRAFFGVPKTKDLWWDSRDDENDGAVLVFGEAELEIADGDKFFTAHKEINSGD